MPTEEPQIPIHRELEIRDGKSAYKELGGALEGQLKEPWRRAHKREEEVSGNYDYQVYERVAQDERPGLMLFLLPREADVFVPNIVPTQAGHISRDEYNEALEEFAHQFLGPAAESLGLEWSLGPEELDLSDSLSETTYEALRLFSRTSNKSTGSSHPSDQLKWMDFLISLVESDGDLSTGQLQEWLILDGWSEEVAYDLALEFEFGLALLRHERKH